MYIQCSSPGLSSRLPRGEALNGGDTRFLAIFQLGLTNFFEYPIIIWVICPLNLNFGLPKNFYNSSNPSIFSRDMMESSGRVVCILDYCHSKYIPPKYMSPSSGIPPLFRTHSASHHRSLYKKVVLPK